MSKLVKKIKKILTLDELQAEIDKKKKKEIRSALRKIVFRNWSYEDAARSCGWSTKQNMYDHLNRIYERAKKQKTNNK